MSIKVPSPDATHALCHSLRKFVVSKIAAFFLVDLLQHLHQNVGQRDCGSFAVLGLILFETDERSRGVDLMPLDLLCFTESNAAVIEKGDQRFQIEGEAMDSISEGIKPF